MGCGEAVRSLGWIAPSGGVGLNNDQPRLGGRQSGPDKPSAARTPDEALSYIELLYKSGRTEDLAKLLRRSQVFRTAWLILQQSSSGVSAAGGKAHGPTCGVGTGGPASLPVPVSRPPGRTPNPEPGSSGPEVGKTESFPGVPAAVMATDANNDSSAPGSPAAQLLPLPLQVYLNQDAYWAREKQRGQLVSLRA